MSGYLQSNNFKFLMKTDDDCFVDVERIYSELMEKYQDVEKLWWGRFRNNWGVDLYGKWAETDYKAPGYPR